MSARNYVEIINKWLSLNKYSRTRAANLLGVSRSTLYNWKKYSTLPSIILMEDIEQRLRDKSLKDSSEKEKIVELVNALKKERLATKAEEAISEAPSEEAVAGESGDTALEVAEEVVSEAPSETITEVPSKAVAAKVHKPKITSKARWENFKEKWRNLNPPFKILIISLSAWIAEWIIVAATAVICYLYPNEREIEVSFDVSNIDIDFSELILPIILSFIAIAIITIILYNIIIKTINKRKSQK